MSAQIDRRRFSKLVASGMAAAASAVPGEAAEAMQVLSLHENGWCPNNAALPVLWYHGAYAGSGEDAARRMEAAFARNGWPPQWRNGVYTFHHYHSTAHEVLGFAAGHARLVLGGPGGSEVTVRAGDVLLLPTGTGHCELSSSEDFVVIGAYPDGQHWDICRGAPDVSARERMASLPFPHTDPVHGAGGPLAKHWLHAG